MIEAKRDKSLLRPLAFLLSWCFCLLGLLAIFSWRFRRCCLKSNVVCSSNRSSLTKLEVVCNLAQHDFIFGVYSVNRPSGPAFSLVPLLFLFLLSVLLFFVSSLALMFQILQLLACLKAPTTGWLSLACAVCETCERGPGVPHRHGHHLPQQCQARQ